jgi:hypothetical protein
MLRRSVVCSVVLVGFASWGYADWTNWSVHQPGPFFVQETASVPVNPGPNGRCVAFGILDFATAAKRAEVWCTQNGLLTQMNVIDVGDTLPSVAMNVPPDSFGIPTLPAYAITDPDNQQIWYGIAGQPPELAVEGNRAFSLSLAHYPTGEPILVYRGHNDVLYTAARKPTGEWSEMQLTNNSSGFARWSVDAVIRQGILHVAYWDATWQAVRYGRKEGATWIFETVKNLAGTDYVSPAVEGDDEGRAYVAYAGRDGLLHYFRRTAPGTWVESTFTPPQPVSTDFDQGKIGFAVDNTRRAHFLYGTGNGGVEVERVLRYVSNGPAGNWQYSTAVTSVTNNPEGYRGIDLAWRGRFSQKLVASWSVTLVGILQLGCNDCQ